MTNTRANSAAILTPEQVTQLIITPLAEQSVALAASTVIPCAGSSLRVPVVSSTPTASWTAEGAEIALTDAGLSEVDISFYALKAISALTSELANDSSPAAVSVIGEAILRDLIRQVDAAFFAAATTAPANTPAGLGTLPTTGAAGAKINTVAAGTVTNLDAFQDAILNAEARYVAPDQLTFVAAPATVGALLKIKDATSSARPLINTDVTVPSLRTIGGVALVASPSVAAGVVWCIPRSRVIVGLRSDADLQIDSSAYFSSDRIAVRVVERLGWGFTDLPSITKITVS